MDSAGSFSPSILILTPENEAPQTTKKGSAAVALALTVNNDIGDCWCWYLQTAPEIGGKYIAEILKLKSNIADDAKVNETEYSEITFLSSAPPKKNA